VAKKITKAYLIEKSKAENDGKTICYICENEFKPEQLIKEHKDNNRKNNKEENLGLACRECNYKKNPPKFYKLKGESFDSMCERVRVSMQQLPKAQSAEMDRNQTAKPLFDKWFYSEMLLYQEMEVEDIKYSGSKIAGVVPSTVLNNYLKPHCSRIGEFEMFEVDKVKKVKWKRGERDKYIKQLYSDEIKKYVKD
jgi:hypothetical protein